MKIETTKVYRFYTKVFDAKMLRLFRRQMRRTWSRYKKGNSPYLCFDRHWFLVIKDIHKNYPEMIKLSKGETEALFDKTFALPKIQVAEND